MTECGLHAGGELAGRVGRPGRELDRTVEEVGVGHALPRQPGRGCSLAVEALAEQANAAAACGPTARSSSQVCPPPGWMPSAGSGCRSGRGAGDADVAGQREVHARADRRSVDRRDVGRGHPDPKEALVDLADIVRVLTVGAEPEVRQVGTRAEAGPRR